MPIDRKFDIADVSKLTLREALALHEGLSSLIDVATALLGQPRFNGEMVLNPAGEVIDRLCDQMHLLCEEAMATIAAAESTDHWERIFRAELLLRRAVSEIEDPPELERILASLAAWPRAAA
ncbi:hypothetical protein [Bosea massiliensis]|uniref:Uncharacterized protein n=1 Tax=Bosea massiliensis TaxID=151419 RepID=A0ABW0P032_9HYPH